MDNLLVIDSSVLRTDYVLLRGTEVLCSASVEGINPTVDGEREIMRALSQFNLSEEVCLGISEVYFYGKGCFSLDKREQLCNILSKKFPNAFIDIQPDVLGYAHAIFRQGGGALIFIDAGIDLVVIDNGELLERKCGEGYILGEDASLAQLGKQLVIDSLQNRMPEELRIDFVNTFGLKKEQLVKEVYQKNLALKRLVNYALFANKHASHPYILQVVRNMFTRFVSNILVKDDHLLSCPYVFVGDLPATFESLLREILKTRGVKLEGIHSRDVGIITRYHSQQVLSASVN